MRLTPHPHPQTTTLTALTTLLLLLLPLTPLAQPNPAHDPEKESRIATIQALKPIPTAVLLGGDAARQAYQLRHEQDIPGGDLGGERPGGVVGRRRGWWWWWEGFAEGGDSTEEEGEGEVDL